MYFVATASDASVNKKQGELCSPLKDHHKANQILLTTAKEIGLALHLISPTSV